MTQPHASIRYITQSCLRSAIHVLTVALALMSIWTKYVKQDQPQLLTGSFVDDCHLCSTGDSEQEVACTVATAWQRSVEFDRFGSIETNQQKTFVFANSVYS